MNAEPVDDKFAHLIHIGKEADFIQASGRKITIREWNGEDEDTMSKKSGILNDGSSVNNFISAIVVKDHQLGRKPLPSDIAKWGIKDKYLTLLFARILTLGPVMKFYHACSNPQCDFVNDIKAPWSENLDNLLWDLSLPEKPKEGDPKFNPKLSPFAITKYPQGIETQIVFTTTSGKVLRYNILDSIGETTMLNVPETEKVKSDGLRARNLEIQVKGEWLPVKSFKLFSAQDSAELWADVTRNDSGFQALTDITCPKCQLRELIDLMTHPGFFSPVGI